MAGFGEYSVYGRPTGFPQGSEFSNNRDPNDQLESRYQHLYGYTTPLHEEYQGPPLVHDDPGDEDTSAIITTGISFASLITENLLSHPFIVLRRQCQVHNTLKSYHIVPYTLLPVVIRLHRRQDITTLWKGIGSTCIVKGLNLGVEEIISKTSGWPKDFNKCQSIVQFAKHILLKCASLAIITPFYSASFVETVQSDIASDKPGVLDVFREGANRMLEWGAPSKGRMLPVWAIIAPTIGFGLSKYIISLALRKIAAKVLRFQQRHRYEFSNCYSQCDQKPTTNPIVEEIQLKANMFAFIATEVIFYPVETVIHRLHIQGTRTIIDNLDTGISVLPILTCYEGFRDCYYSILAKEGAGGLYKGFGALVLQLSAHIAIIKVSTWIVTEIANLLKPVSKTPSVSHSDASIHSQQKYLFN